MLFLEATASNAGGFSSITSVGMLVLMFALLYFLMIRPERKKKKEAEQMRDSLKVGDDVTTIGGIVGEVCHIKDDNIVIEVGADRVRIEFKKWAISSNDSAAAEARKAAEERRAERAKEKEYKNSKNYKNKKQ